MCGWSVGCRLCGWRVGCVVDASGVGGEAGHRGQGAHRIAMDPDEACVGKELEQGVEGHQVGGVLQHPPLAVGTVVLEHLELLASFREVMEEAYELEVARRGVVYSPGL